MTDINELIGEIEAFCRQQLISKSTFGLRVVNDGKLVTRHLGFKVKRQEEYEALLVDTLNKSMESE